MPTDYELSDLDANTQPILQEFDDFDDEYRWERQARMAEREEYA